MKNKKIILILFIILLSVFSISCANTIYAAFEVSYPQIPGFPALPPKPSTGAYVSYFVGAIIFLSAAITLISFVIGAVSVIISGDNAERLSSAKDRMKGSILGMVLVLSAFIILKTINPTFITPTLIALPGVDGLYFANSANDILDTAPSYKNNSTIETEYRNLLFKCTPPQNGTGPTLLVWLYSEPNQTGSVTVRRMPCGTSDKIGLSADGSYKTTYETPGIYLCENGCNGSYCANGDMSEVIVTDIVIPEKFKDKVRGVLIVNNTLNHTSSKENVYYSVILKTIDLEHAGQCNDPMPGVSEVVGSGQYKCLTVDKPSFASYANVIKQYNDTSKFGDGVGFYSETFGWNSGQNAGVFTIDSEFGRGTNHLSVEMEANAMMFDYSGATRPPSYTEANKTFQDKPLAIHLLSSDSYLVALYTMEDDNGNAYCQTFRSDVSNLGAKDITSEGRKIEKVYVFPTF